MTPRRRIALGVVAVALLVLFAPPVEGPVLWVVSTNHGLATSDLVSLALVSVGAVLWLRD